MPSNLIRITMALLMLAAGLFSGRALADETGGAQVAATPKDAICLAACGIVLAAFWLCVAVMR
jgi:hypothetical protein